MSEDITRSVAADRIMRLRYAGICRLCRIALAARSQAIYEPSTKTVRCLECASGEVESGDEGADSVEPEPTRDVTGSGIAGSSARREYERRKAKDEERIRSRWGRMGGIAVVLSPEKQSTTAWATGAVGEERLGALLSSVASDDLAVLHDRRIPGSRANIDHIVICRTGVWIVDAKRFQGRPELRVEGGILRPRVEKLFVDGRDRTRLVDGVIKQVELVRGLVDPVPVTGALCFVNANWPLIGGAFTTRGIHAFWPRRLVRSLTEITDGPVDVATVSAEVAARFTAA